MGQGLDIAFSDVKRSKLFISFLTKTERLTKNTFHFLSVFQILFLSLWGKGFKEAKVFVSFCIFSERKDKENLWKTFFVITAFFVISIFVPDIHSFNMLFTSLLSASKISG